MDFMRILKEAKDEKTTTIDATEAAEDENATDYSAEADEAADDTPEETDDTETPDEESDTTGDETEESDEGESEEETTEDEDAADDEEDGPTDYTEGTDDVGGDEEGSDESDTSDDMGASDTTEEAPSDDPYAKQNKFLLDDFVELYNNINMNIKKFDRVKSLDMLTSSIVAQVKSNLGSLSDHIYKYITLTFSSKTYADNLYTYKYAIQLYKICVQMLSKINDFGDDT